MRYRKALSFILIAGMVCVSAVLILWNKKSDDLSSYQAPVTDAPETDNDSVFQGGIPQEGVASDTSTDSGIPRNPQPIGIGEFSPPLERSGERVTKKPFGKRVDPENSPVSPERFRGYHTGVDFEIFSSEAGSDVKVASVCSGTVVAKRFVSGYGGTLAQTCELDGQVLTILYGHLRIESITPNVGDKVRSGDVIALLGDDKSRQTDGERKHLHLGFRKGPEIDWRGYVTDRKYLDAWTDPCRFVCANR